jgi:hypothetical protein
LSHKTCLGEFNAMQHKFKFSKNTFFEKSTIRPNERFFGSKKLFLWNYSSKILEMNFKRMKIIYI